MKYQYVGNLLNTKLQKYGYQPTDYEKEMLRNYERDFKRKKYEQESRHG